MVNFHDPLVLELDSLALITLFNVLAGLYIWEFFITLHYEWSVVRGRRPYLWTIWIYSITRLATLVAVLLELFVSTNRTTPTNCQILGTFLYVFGYIAVAFSSLLIALRAIAIWNKSKVIVGLATSVWLTNLSFLILGITKIHSIWVPALYTGSCSLPDVESNKATMIVLLVTDTVLLLIMLFGLLRLRRFGGGAFELARLLWKQGVIWLMLATVAEVTPVVFICLDLNAPLNAMFLMPTLIMMSIAATRMYRSLTDFCPAADITRGSEGPQRIGHIALNARLTASMPLSYGQVEVAVHTAYEQNPGLQTDRYVSYIGMDGQLGDKPRRLSFDDDLESRVEK